MGAKEVGFPSPAGLVRVLDRLSDGIIVLGRDWRVRYINEPGGMMLGRPAAKLLNTHIWDEFPEAVGGSFQIAYEKALETGQTSRLVEDYEPLGAWFESRIFPQEDELVILFRDVTAEQQAEDELREYVERMAEAERIVRFGVWRWHIASGRVSWSDELHRIYGLPPRTFEGTVDAFVERVHPDDRERVWSNISHSLETMEPFVFEERITRADGSERILLSQGRVIVDADGGATALVGVCNDITDRAHAERALGASERRMREIIDNTPSMITVKDLDGRYLMINAEAERIIGKPAREVVDQHCIDVFPAEIAEPQRANEQLAASEGGPIYGEALLPREGEPRTFVTVTFPLPGVDGLPEEICTIATDVTERRERESERRERIEWTERIASALAENRMLAFAQPIVCLETGTEDSRELLVRMRAPGERSEILEPGSFLPAAERFELIAPIDLWMVRQALGASEETPVHVNLSAITMSDPEARGEIVAMLAAAPEAARRIVFEITETVDVVRLEAAREFARAVKEIGGKLALDDFGVGFGSFTYLHSLPLSYIKIDTSFVLQLTSSAEMRRLVKSIIGVAREFNLPTIAEGVEDEQTLELLREMGAGFVQGYLLGRPEPLSAGSGT
jgi:PAS domain S-box-containing protein